MYRLLACFLALLIVGCNPAKPTPLVPKHLPHKPHVDEKLARIEVLDFYTTWCIPCRVNAPTVDILIAQGHKITKIDAEQETDQAKKYDITMYPTYVVLKHGKEVFRTSNVQELRRYLNKRLWHHGRQDDKSVPVNRGIPINERPINYNVWSTPGR